MKQLNTIGLVDYGAGNLRSVKKAFEYLNSPVKLVRKPEDMKDVAKLVLPGVGAFGAAAENLKNQGLFGPIKDWLDMGEPFLGICLGLQLLFQRSEESGSIEGLGFFNGYCTRFKAKKVPQIGWNQLKIQRGDPIFEGIDTNNYFYFLHGYYVVPEDDYVSIGKTDYGVEYSCLVKRGRVYGIQFHPEKSGMMGVQMLKNWSESC